MSKKIEETKVEMMEEQDVIEEATALVAADEADNAEVSESEKKKLKIGKKGLIGIGLGIIGAGALAVKVISSLKSGSKDDEVDETDDVDIQEF